MTHKAYTLRKQETDNKEVPQPKIPDADREFLVLETSSVSKAEESTTTDTCKASAFPKKYGQGQHKRTIQLVICHADTSRIKPTHRLFIWPNLSAYSRKSVAMQPSTAVLQCTAVADIYIFKFHSKIQTLWKSTTTSNQ